MAGESLKPESRDPEQSEEVERLQRQVASLTEANTELTEQKAKLVGITKELRESIAEQRERLDALSKVPNLIGTYVESIQDENGGISATDVEVAKGGLRMVVSGAAETVAKLVPGQDVFLSLETNNIVRAGGFPKNGSVGAVKEAREDGTVLITGHTDEEMVLRRGGKLFPSKESGEEPIVLKPGDSVVYDDRSGFAHAKVETAEVAELELEKVPDISYEDIGGLTAQIEQIQDSVELPYLYPEKYKEHNLAVPKGILLYGPPGCGKTLIAKAVANSLAKTAREKTGKGDGTALFLVVNGPELLNKYVGETERHIRLLFQKARENATDETPVIIFLDEFDSLGRSRGSGISSDMESTIVPTILAEIDGIEANNTNVIVIAASNRQDSLDPAILRPGRFDAKIKVDRPDKEAAADILSKYITADIPIHKDELRIDDGDIVATLKRLVSETNDLLYDTENDDNKFIEVTYASGDKEVLYFKDFCSGAMLKNIVDRAKKASVKSDIATNGIDKGLTVGRLEQAVRDECKENEDLPNTANPEEWAKISGRKGERIVYMRTLANSNSKDGGRKVENVQVGSSEGTGQYL